MHTKLAQWSLRVCIVSDRSPIPATAPHANVVAVVVYDGAGIVRLAGSVVGVTGVHDILLHGTYQLNEQCLGRVVLLNAKEQKSDTWRFAMVSGGVRLLTVSDSSPNMKPFVQERRWGWAHFVEK